MYELTPQELQKNYAISISAFIFGCTASSSSSSSSSTSSSSSSSSRLYDTPTHLDDSDLTVNICLYRSADLQGSSIEFDLARPSRSMSITHSRGSSNSQYAATESQTTYRHQTGHVLIHPGDLRHKVEPITQGERFNLLLWLKLHPLSPPQIVCETQSNSLTSSQDLLHIHTPVEGNNSVDGFDLDKWLEMLQINEDSASVAGPLSSPSSSSSSSLSSSSLPLAPVRSSLRCDKLENLPVELLVRIFVFTDGLSVCRLSQCSRLLYQVAQQEQVWRVSQSVILHSL
jgi:hypothetical protein